MALDFVRNLESANDGARTTDIRVPAAIRAAAAPENPWLTSSRPWLRQYLAEHIRLDTWEKFGAIRKSEVLVYHNSSRKSEGGIQTPRLRGAGGIDVDLKSNQLVVADTIGVTLCNIQI